MRRFVQPLSIVAATLACAWPVRAQDTFVVKGVFDNASGLVVWRWIDASGVPHDSGQSEGTASEVEPSRRLNGRLVVPVRNGDKVRFEVENMPGSVIPHGVIFENGKIEAASASPVWSRVSGMQVKDLPTAPPFNDYDRTKANTTDPVRNGEIIEIEIKSLPDDQPIFFACRVHSISGGHSMFGALVLATEKNNFLVKRVIATSRMVSTGTSNKLSFDEALRDAISQLPPTPFPDGIRTFSVIETTGTLGGIAGAQVLRVTILADDEPGYGLPTDHGGGDAHPQAE